MSVPRRFALAALMAVSAVGGVRADEADPPAAVAGRDDAKGVVAVQPAAAQALLATPPNTKNATTPARSEPASHTQSASPGRRARKTKPSSGHHQVPSTTRHVSAPDAAARNQLPGRSAPVNRPRPATAPPQAARQAKNPAPSAASPPAAHGAEPVVIQTQTSDPDPRDAAAHADRTSRDRAQR